MCSAALKKNDIMPRKMRPVRSAPGRAGTKLKPKSKAHLSKSGMLQNRGLDRIVGVQVHRDENRFVTRIHGKWAFSILSRLQDGPTPLSELRRTLPQTSRKKLTRYLCDLEKAGLIVPVDRSGKIPKAEYVLSDPLGIAAVHLMNALVQSIEEAPEPEPHDLA